MPLSPQETTGVARAILHDLAQAEQLPRREGNTPALVAVGKALKAYFAEEEALEREAAQLATQHLKAAGREAVGLDTRKVTLMIKQRLAKERGFPL